MKKILSQVPGHQQITTASKQVKSTFWEWMDLCGTADIATQAAALSFYAILSIPATLGVVVGTLLHYLSPSFQQKIWKELQSLLEGQHDGIASAVLNLNLPNLFTPSVGGIIGLVGAIFFAIGFFVQLQGALGNIWEIKSEGVWEMINRRLLSLGILFGIAIILYLLFMLGAVADWTMRALGISSNLNLWFLSFGFFVAVFILIYGFLLRNVAPWRVIWTSSVLTTLALMLARTFVALYLNAVKVPNFFGALGGVVIFILWIYYIAFAFLAMAALSRVIWMKEESALASKKKKRAKK